MARPEGFEPLTTWFEARYSKAASAYKYNDKCTTQKMRSWAYFARDDL